MKLSDLQKKILITMLNREEERLKKHGKLSEDPVLAGHRGRRILPRTLMSDLAEMEKEREPYSATQFAVKYDVIDHDARRALKALCEKHLLIDHILIFRNRTKRMYELTDRGRALAKRLRFHDKIERLEREGKLEGELKRQLEAALKALKKRLAEKAKPPFATPEEVLEALWENSKEWYEGERSLFDEFWSKKKLGKIMKSLGFELVREILNGKRAWIYILRDPEEDAFDMTVALAYLRKAQNLSNVDYWCILAALWLTTGQKKYSSKEALLAYWTRKRVGRLLKSMGFKSHRKTWRKETLRMYNIAKISQVKLTDEMIDMVVEAPRRVSVYADTRYDFLAIESRMKGIILPEPGPPPEGWEYF